MAERNAALIGLDPTSGPLPAGGGRDRPAPRPKSLDGAVIGLVANGLGQAEAFLARLYEELAEGTAGALAVLKGSVSIPPEPEDWARLTSEATVAITGFGG